MAELETYGAYQVWTPSQIIPEPGDSITWDWMDGVAQFAQKFRQITTLVGSMNFNGTLVFDYGAAFNYDYFPPILKAYYYCPSEDSWRQFDFATTYLYPGGTATNFIYGSYARDSVQFRNIGLGTAQFVNHVLNNVTVWQLIAYM